MSVLFDPTAVKSIDHEAVRQISFLGLSEEIMRELNAIPEQVFPQTPHSKYRSRDLLNLTLDFQ